MVRSLLYLGLVVAFAKVAAFGSGVAFGQTPSTPPVPPADVTVPTIESLSRGAVETAETEESIAGEAGESYVEGAEATTGATASAGAEEAARLKIWESPAMIDARKYIEEYGRRSKQFNSQAAARYLDQLRRSSPVEMRAWLTRYQARRAGEARSAAVARAARQTAVDQTMARLQGVQDSYDNFNAGQTAGAEIARERYARQQFGAGQIGLAKQSARDSFMTFQSTMDYRWIIDPPWWVKERAAAASVPGDLPAGDPGNFIRGDVPVPGEPAVGAGAGAGGAGGGVDGGAGAGGPP